MEKRVHFITESDFLLRHLTQCANDFYFITTCRCRTFTEPPELLCRSYRTGNEACAAGGRWRRTPRSFQNECCVYRNQMCRGINGRQNRRNESFGTEFVVTVRGFHRTSPGIGQLQQTIWPHKEINAPGDSVQRFLRWHQLQIWKSGKLDGRQFGDSRALFPLVKSN